MPLTFQKLSVTEVSKKRSVYGYFACDASEMPAEMMEFRVFVKPEGYPRIAECQLEALRHVQSAITVEIERLQRLENRKS